MEVLAVQISVSFAVAEWPLKGRCAKAAAASAPGARRNQNAATPQSEPKQNKRCLIFTYELMMLLWLTVQQAGVGLKGPVFVEELTEPVPIICNLSHFASLYDYILFTDVSLDVTFYLIFSQTVLHM